MIDQTEVDLILTKAQNRIYPEIDKMNDEMDAQGIGKKSIKRLSFWMIMLGIVQEETIRCHPDYKSARESWRP